MTGSPLDHAALDPTLAAALAACLIISLGALLLFLFRPSTASIAVCGGALLLAIAAGVGTELTGLVIDVAGAPASSDTRIARFLD